MITTNLLNWKLKSLDDLVTLSNKSYMFLRSMLTKENFYLINTYKFPILPNLINNKIWLYLLFNSLTNDQKIIIEDILIKINNNDNNLFCLDAGPGTGKTFVVANITLISTFNVMYIVYSRKLTNDMSILYKIDSVTVCNFLMCTLKINYYAAIHFFNSSKFENVEEQCLYIQKIVNEIETDLIQHELFILDEYTIVSPFLIYFFHLFSKKFNVSVLFVGDRYQQSSLNCSVFHPANNYFVIKNLNCSIYNLTTRMRQIDDEEFQNILETIKKYLENSTNDEICNFPFKLKMYEMLYKYFYNEENFDCIFISQYHREIKKRCVQFLKKNQNNCIVCPMLDARNKPILDKTKYINFLVMVPDKEYIYIPSNKKRINVIFIKKIKNVLFCRDKITKKIYEIKRKSVDTSFIPSEYIKILKENYNKIKQFPLTMLNMTYHSAQGLTIKNNNVELDLNCSTINGFYVGITRITKLSQLNKIHVKELNSLEYTLKINDEYYYNINNLNDLSNISETKNIETFSKKATKNLKIKRDLFQNKKTNKQSALCEYINLHL